MPQSPSPPLAIMSQLSLAAVMRQVSLFAAVLSSAFGLPADGHAVPAAADEHGVLAYAFDMSEVRLLEGRWLGNQERTLNYLLDVDVDRLLYNFRANHDLDTQGADPTGAWEGTSLLIELSRTPIL